MPYVITTTTPTGGESSLAVGKRTRVAVATLEEARKAAARAIIADPTADGAIARTRECHTIPESGGTVGPLPDGTVIEVERAPWPHIARSGQEWGTDVGRAAILAAFNAQTPSAAA